MKQKITIQFILFYFLSLSLIAQIDITWNGNINNDWATADNWSTGSVPSTDANVEIPSGLTNYPTASGAVTVNTVTMASGTSLLVQNDFTGTITYNRNLASNNWYLISSPVDGEDAFDLLINTGDISENASGQEAIGTYFEGTWTYNYASPFVSGIGYAVKKDTSGNLPFTGTLKTDDVAAESQAGVGTFVLLGNPYPSYIAANTNADSNNNILTINTDELAEATIWLWNASTESYDTKNNASNSFHIAPVQGFFVKKKNNSSTFNITESMQSHGTGATFQKNVRPEIKLSLTSEAISKKSEIYYISGTTKSFDNGYDSSIFGGASHEFVVYTEVAENGTGRKLGIQSLPPSDYENIVIPVGVIAEANKEIIFSTETSNLPTGINVYLEDRIENTFTKLDDANSEYKIKTTEKLDGVGRFYLHTKSSSALSIDSIDLNSIRIYKTNANNLRISGLAQGSSSFKLFNLLGREVLSTSFSTNGNKDIALPNLASGVYIVQLETESGKLNKKITLN